MNNIKPDFEYHIINNYDQLSGKGYELLILPNSSRYYFLNGQWHRENAPAILEIDGHQAWLIHNKSHRLNGPARIYSTGEKEYWIDNKEYEENKYWKIILSTEKYVKKLTKCTFCTYQSEGKEDLLIHYDYEEEKGNLICHQLREYLNVK